MASSPNQPFRIAANGKGRFKSYDATGAVQDPRGTIAVPAGVMVAANAIGVAANTTGFFVPNGSLSSPFLFATRQGTISGEYADGRGDILATTLLVEDHSSQGAEYTGLTVLTPDCCAPFLAATDFHRGFVETFTSLSIRSVSRGLSSIPIFLQATHPGTCRSPAIGSSSPTHCGMPHNKILYPALAASGLFASVSVNTAGTHPDFTLSPPSASATVAPGQTANFTLMATPVANFRRAFSFACNASAAVTCTVGSPSVDAVTGSATVGVTATASSAAASTPMAALALPGVLLAGLGLWRRRRATILLAVGIAMLTFAVAGISGCGGSGGSSKQRRPVTQTLSVTANAGAVSHTTVLTLNEQ